MELDQQILQLIVSKANRMHKMSRGECLDMAKAIVNGQRNLIYGKPEDSFQSIAELWNAYLNAKEPDIETCLSGHDVAIMMSLFKIGRIACSDEYHRDNYVDGCGYLALADDMADENG